MISGDTGGFSTLNPQYAPAQDQVYCEPYCLRQPLKKHSISGLLKTSEKAFIRFTGGGLLFNIERSGAPWRALIEDLAFKKRVFHRFRLIAPPQDGVVLAIAYGCFRHAY